MSALQGGGRMEERNGLEGQSAPNQGEGKGKEPMETGPQGGGSAHPVGGRALPLGLQRAVLADLL